MPDQPQHPSQVIPAENLASPGEMDWGDDIRWWKPGFGETMRHLGLSWLLLLPAIAVIVVLAMSPFDPMLWQIMFIGGGKLVILIVGLPFALAGRAFSKAVKERREPFCMHCGYVLSGLPDFHRCPECGRPFSFPLIEEYRRNPQWFIERWKRRHEVPVRDAPFAAGTGTRRRKSRDGT